MSEFGKKLEEVDSRVRRQVQQKKDAAEEQRRKEATAHQTREEAISAAHGVAVRFTETCIKPVMKEIQTKLPGGMGNHCTNRERGFAGCGIDFGEAESLFLKAYFDETGVRLAAEACCIGSGSVYSERSDTFSVDGFDEQAARTWIEEHAIGAYEAFGRQAEAVRNLPPIVTYNKIEPN